MGAMTPASAAAGEKTGDIHLKFTAWYYADRSKHDEHCKALARFFSSRLPSNLAWTWRVRPDKTMLPVACNQERNKAFTPLELDFSASRTPKSLSMKRSLKIKEDADAFDILFKAVSKIMKSKGLKAAVQSEKAKMVCWALHKRGEPCAPKMSRWVLPVPETPLFFPAERIEQVLYNLVSIQLRRKSDDHAGCGGGAVLECIESQLYSQKQAHERLIAMLDSLASLERDPALARSILMRSTISRTIKALELVDSNLTVLIALFDEHIGRTAPIKGKWKIVPKIKKFIKGPFASVAIDDQELEGLKKKVRSELGTLHRTAPILAAHIRLRDGERKDELQRVCNDATTGPEKSDMVSKLAIVPGNLYNARLLAAQMTRVRAHYEDTYNKVLAGIEAVNKVVGSAYSKDGDKLFNFRGKLGRFGKKKQNPKGRCHLEAHNSAEVVFEKQVVEKQVKYVSDSSDDESWFEKYEPKCMV